MKLIRYGPFEQEKPGLCLDDGSWVDTSEVTEDYDEKFFAQGGLERLRNWLKEKGADAPALDPSVRLGAPVARPSKIICVGLNYAAHAAESGVEPPKEAVIFFKSTTAISGPFDDIRLPRGSEKTDWEVELAVVLGHRASYIEPREAEAHIAGYLLHNDVSERAFQLERGGQWVKGKSCDTFAPLGPWLVTPDEIPDVHALPLWLKVNGELRQNSSTADMIFQVPYLISYISQFMTLLPGDIITTGTPHGVGLGFTPPIYLKAGDVVELGIERLGTSVQRVVAAASRR